MKAYSCINLKCSAMSKMSKMNSYNQHIKEMKIDYLVIFERRNSNKNAFRFVNFSTVMLYFLSNKYCIGFNKSFKDFIVRSVTI